MFKTIVCVAFLCTNKSHKLVTFYCSGSAVLCFLHILAYFTTTQNVDICWKKQQPIVKHDHDVREEQHAFLTKLFRARFSFVCIKSRNQVAILICCISLRQIMFISQTEHNNFQSYMYACICICASLNMCIFLHMMYKLYISELTEQNILASQYKYCVQGCTYKLLNKIHLAN